MQPQYKIRKLACCVQVNRNSIIKHDIGTSRWLITGGMNREVLMTGNGQIYNVQLSANERLYNCTVTLCNCVFLQQHFVCYSNVCTLNVHNKLLLNTLCNSLHPVLSISAIQKHNRTFPQHQNYFSLCPSPNGPNLTTLTFSYILFPYNTAVTR